MFRPLIVLAVFVAGVTLTASASAPPRIGQVGCEAEDKYAVIEMDRRWWRDPVVVGHPVFQMEASGMVVRRGMYYAADWDTVPTLHGSDAGDGWGVLILHFADGDIDTIGWVRQDCWKKMRGYVDGLAAQGIPARLAEHPHR